MNLFRIFFAGVEVSWIEEVVVVLVTKFDFDLLLADVEGVGHVFEKDQAEDGVLVNCRIEIGSQFVCCGSEFLVEFLKKLLSFIHASAMGVFDEREVIVSVATSFDNQWHAGATRGTLQTRFWSSTVVPTLSFQSKKDWGNRSAIGFERLSRYLLITRPDLFDWLLIRLLSR